MTGTTVVTRTPEWDDEARADAIELFEYDKATCRRGHHVSTGFDDTVARAVHHEKIECLDCKAIDKVIDEYHKKKRHDQKNVKCDCDKYATWIIKRTPLGQVKSKSLMEGTGPWKI